MWESFLDLLFPRAATDTEELLPLSAPLIEEKGQLRSRGLLFLDRIVAAGAHERSFALRKAIHIWKYRRISSHAERLGMLLVRSLPSDVPRDAVLCAVPLHWTRKFWRGFNQAELLTRVIARETGMSHRFLLRRVRPTGSQARRGREERLTSMVDAFRVIGSVPPHVILVDDVTTTGATLDMCAKALKAAGAETVEGWTLTLG